ncbi:hypothetical protein [Tumebacillus flagellatus]|uniref:Uncharacterized protein n=1 Tax=Tumebacillus flagellatus TaxID=1157490 RepID=A0A074LWF7_9BACL|nr:hypothetical protein [Tumebacillus flagellatus]KEO84413.1 hypothetical protein EL26_04745 [Tumebacillus flagellatus]
MEEALQTFDCPSCGHEVHPDPLEGERGNQSAACSSCGSKYTRTFAFFKDEWVFGLWRSSETGKVACTYYKTAFGTTSDDC